MGQREFDLGEAELEVLKALWDAGPATVREVLNRLHGSGRRVAKYDLRVECYGSLDETNAAIGLARLHTRESLPVLDAMLARIQNDLFDLGADLCFPDETRDARGARGRARV